MAREKAREPEETAVVRVPVPVLRLVINVFQNNFGNIFKSGLILVCQRGSLMEKKKTEGIIYECIRCGAEVPLDELEFRGGQKKCIVCGYRVLRKNRPPVVKRVTGE